MESKKCHLKKVFLSNRRREIMQEGLGTRYRKPVCVLPMPSHDSSRVSILGKILIPCTLLRGLRRACGED